MIDSLGSELIHVTCPTCHNIPSFSLESVKNNSQPLCPFCSSPIPIDLSSAEADAIREAHDLDDSVDSLGNVE